MIFRPKIFISSTFKENKSLRADIHDFFVSVGAEPMLYEKEMTPSVIPKAYRTILLDADFMILIVKSEYGTKTEHGISGIHEEYKIALNNKIPLHVYLQKSDEDTTSVDDNSENTEEKNNPLIDDLTKDGISYYYFADDDELMKRLKETTFTIAKEIMMNQVAKSVLPRDVVNQMAVKIDYNRALEVISIIESMREVAYRNEVDFRYTNIVTECFECILCEFKYKKHHFINWEIDNKLCTLLSLASDYISHSVLDFTSTGVFREYKISVLGKIGVSNLTYCQNTDWDLNEYNEQLNEIFNAYVEFKNLIKDVKIDVDIIRN